MGRGTVRKVNMQVRGGLCGFLMGTGKKMYWARRWQRWSLMGKGKEVEQAVGGRWVFDGYRQEDVWGKEVTKIGVDRQRYGKEAEGDKRVEEKMGV